MSMCLRNQKDKMQKYHCVAQLAASVTDLDDRIIYREAKSPTQYTIWEFAQMGVPRNGWFTVENPIRMDDLGVPHGTSILGNLRI